MKLFIDTANLEEIEAAHSCGVLDGVTTNPTLLAKEKAQPQAQLKKICRIVKGPVSAEVTSLVSKGMVEEAKGLAENYSYVG